MPGLLKLPSRNKNYDSIHYLCTVKFLDDSEALSVTYQRDTKGRFLVDYVCSSIDLLEKDYFGLKYTDADKQECWIDPLKSIHSQLKGISNPLLFFHVKFYPSDPSVIKEEITRYQLFLQVRKDLEENRLICSLQDALLLSAYIVQAEFGDCIDVLPPPTPQSLPYSASPSLTHQPSSPAWKYILYVKLPSSLKGYEENIYQLHHKLKGMKPAEAEFNFLKKASTLPSFGIDPYIVQDVKGEQLYLAVTPQGIVSFVDNQATNTYHWRSIKKMSFDGKMFYIKLKRDEDDDNKPHETGPSIFSKVVPFNKSNIHHPTVAYKCLSAPSCKQLWKNSVAHNFFYTLKSSEEAPKVVSSGSGLFSRGSKFRYSGHCLSEVYKSSASIDRPQPKFTRYSSRLRPGSASAVRSTTLPFSWKSMNNNNNGSNSRNDEKHEREGDSSVASLSTSTTAASSVITSLHQQSKKCTSDSALLTADGKLNHTQQPSLNPLQIYKQQQKDDNHVPLLITGDVECDFNAPYRSTPGHDVINTCEIINISDDGEESDSDDDEILNTFNSNGKMDKNEILEINKKIETLFLNGEKLDNKMILNPNFVGYDEPTMNSSIHTDSKYNKTGKCLENTNTSTAAVYPCLSIAPFPKPSHTMTVHSGYIIDSLPSSLPATAPSNAPTPSTSSLTASTSFAVSDPPTITLTTTFVNIATPSQKIDSLAKNQQSFVSSLSSSSSSSQPTTYSSEATTVTSFRETPLNDGRVEESWVTESRGTKSLDGWIIEEGEKRMKYTDNSYDTGYTSSGSETVNDNDGDDACVKQSESLSEKLEKPESKSGIRKSLLNLLSFVSSLNKAVEGKHGDERDACDGEEQGGHSGAGKKIIVSDDGDLTPINPIDIVDSFSKASIVIPATSLQSHPLKASPELFSSTKFMTQDLSKPSSTPTTQHIVELTTSLSSPPSHNQHIPSLSPSSPTSSSSLRKMLTVPPTTPDDDIQHSHPSSIGDTQHVHSHQTSSYTPSRSSDNPSAENYERIKEIRKLLQENKDRIQEIRNTIDNEIKKPLGCYSVSSDSIDITRQIWSEYVVTSSNSMTNKLSSPTLNNHYHNQLSRDDKEAEATEHHRNVDGRGEVDPAVTSAYPIPISFINNQFEWCGEGGENSGGVGVIINNCIYPDLHHLANVGVCSEYVPDEGDVANDVHEQNHPDGSDNKFICGGFVGAITNVISERDVTVDDMTVDDVTVDTDPRVNDNEPQETEFVLPKINQILTSLPLFLSPSSSSPVASSFTTYSMHGQPPPQNSHLPSNRPPPPIMKQHLQEFAEPPPISSDSQLLESTFALLHENDSSSHAKKEGCEITTSGELAQAHIADTSVEQNGGEVVVATRADNSKGTMHYIGKGVCLTLTSVLLSLILFSIFVIIIFECFKEERYINDYIIIREFKSSVYDLIKQYITEMLYRHVFRFW